MWLTGAEPFAAAPSPVQGGSVESPTDDGASRRSATTPEDAPASDETLLTASSTSSGFALAGITWDAGTGATGTEVEIRTRTGDVWSDWQQVEVETEEASAGAEETADDVVELRDGTDPWVVGRVDEVQVALRGVGDSMPTGPGSS
ncbi:hypothetical protein NKG05_20770 [Oerskovia sp. M15]